MIYHYEPFFRVLSPIDARARGKMRGKRGLFSSFFTVLAIKFFNFFTKKFFPFLYMCAHTQKSAKKARASHTAAHALFGAFVSKKTPP